MLFRWNWKCKISAIYLVETAYIFLIFLIVTVQISLECEPQQRDIQTFGFMLT